MATFRGATPDEIEGAARKIGELSAAGGGPIYSAANQPDGSYYNLVRSSDGMSSPSLELAPLPAPRYSDTYVDDLVYRGEPWLAVPLASSAGPPPGASVSPANAGANQPDGSYYQPFDPNVPSPVGLAGVGDADPAAGDRAMAAITAILGDGWQGQPQGATGNIGYATQPVMVNAAAAGSPDQSSGPVRSPYCPAGADQCWPTIHSTTISGFGNRTNPSPEFHDGIDIRSRLGEPVYSVENGTVLSIYHNPKGGDQVLIQNEDGSLSGYAHTGALGTLQEGQKVRTGEQIGISNGSGTTNSHLHYTYRLPEAGGPATRRTNRVDPFANELDDLVLPPNP